MTVHYPARSALPFALLGLLFLTGCVSLPDDYRDPRDPWEAYNRGMFQFNTDFDNAFMKPIAKGYKEVVPDPLDKGITNFFHNLADVTSAANSLLQFKLSHAASDVGRLAVNSTLGGLGFVDVASNMGLTNHKEDFGQTLGYWGVSSGPYLVLPLLGPSTLRDTVGLVGDKYTDPLFWGPEFGINWLEGGVHWGLVGLRTIDRRADLLTASKLLEDAALDPYIFVRDAYLQRRRSLVYDGNPPKEDYEELWNPEVPSEGAAQP